MCQKFVVIFFLPVIQSSVADGIISEQINVAFSAKKMLLFFYLFNKRDTVNHLTGPGIQDTMQLNKKEPYFLFFSPLTSLGLSKIALDERQHQIRRRIQWTKVIQIARLCFGFCELPIQPRENMLV